MAYKDIEQERAYHREYMRERHKWLKDHHFCTECKKQDAYTLAGRYRCYECTQKHNEYKTSNHKQIDYAADRTQNRSTDKIRRSERPANGLCYLCGKPLSGIQLAYQDRESHLCDECYKKSAESLKIARISYSENHNGHSYGWTRFN